MNKKWKRRATAQVYKVVGNNYSMKRLVEWIENASDRTEMLMFCLTALTPDKKVESKKKAIYGKSF